MSGDDFDDFDPIDRALSGGLRGIAPTVVDGDVTLESLRPRLRRARTRSHLVRAGAAVATFVAIGSAVAVAAPQRRADHVHVAAPTTSVDVTTRPARHRSTTTTTSATVEPTPATNVMPTAPRPAAPAPRTPVIPVPASPATTAAPAPGGSPPTTVSDPPSSTTTVARDSEVHTYTSPGGRATVRFGNGALQLVSYSAEPGYTVEVDKNEATDIEVRFDNNDASYRTRVRVENGVVVADESQH